MANPTASKVVSGKPVTTGGVLAAPLGTALPADTAVTLNAAFIGLGYVTEGGVARAEERESNETKAWGGLVVKKTQTGFSATFQLELLEYLNPDGAKAIYGDSAVTVTAATVSLGTRIKVEVKGQEAPHKAWVFDMVDGVARTRITVGDGQVTETGTTTYATEDAVVRPITITCYPDANGVLFTELSDDGVTI